MEITRFEVEDILELKQNFTHLKTGITKPHILINWSGCDN